MHSYKIGRDYFQQAFVRILRIAQCNLICQENVPLKISPYLIRMQLDPIKLTGIKIPLVGTNDLNIKYLLGRFEEVFENVKILDYRLDYTSGYIDPDDSNDYINEFNNKYIEIGKSFLTYPMVFQKPDEMEVKI